MRSTFVLLALLAFAAPALADVGPAPTCPTGQQSAYFRGRYCAPVECVGNDPCPSGSTCEERALCLQARDPNGHDSVAVVGECENGTCPSGGTCTRKKFCGEPGSGASAAPTPTPSTPASDPAPTASPSGGSADSPPVPETAPSSPGRSRGCGIGPVGTSAEGALPFALVGLGLALAFRDVRRRRG